MEKIEVLMIEDNQGAGMAIKYLIESFDSVEFVVDISTSLKDGLRKIVQKKYDIILLDLILPNGEGLSVFKKVKKVRKDIPIIIISGYEDKALEAVRAGAEDYLVKPINKKDLFKSLRYSLERSKIKKELRESRKKYFDLFYNAPDMYFNIDYNGKILDYNKTAREILGYCRKDLIGKSVCKIVYRDDANKVKKHFEDMIQNNKHISNVQFRKVTKNGKIIWVDETTKFYNNNGKTEFLIICRDITDKVESERLINKLIEERQSTWNKEKEQLMEMKKKAESLEETVLDLEI